MQKKTKQDQNQLKAAGTNMDEKDSQQPRTLGCGVKGRGEGGRGRLAVAGRLEGCYVLVIGRVNTPKRCSPIPGCAK